MTREISEGGVAAGVGGGAKRREIRRAGRSHCGGSADCEASGTAA